MRQYKINGNGNPVNENIEDRFLENLRKAVEKNDFVKYRKLIDSNTKILNGIDNDFWCETFSGNSRDEILFWIDYPERQLNICDLCFIKPEFEDLFYIGLKRQDLSVDGADQFVDELEFELERLTEAENGEVILEPVDYQGITGHILYVDENGITGSMYLGGQGGRVKVIRSDGLLTRVDFTQEKNRLRNKIDVIKELM
jgi:hypothetical protein